MPSAKTQPTPSHSAAAETAIPFHKLPSWIASEYGTEPVHLATVHRWRIRGVDGVLLPTFRVGVQRYCRPSDVREFIRAINVKS